jgi:hypothetical protein
MNTDKHRLKNMLFSASVFICVHLWLIPGCASDKHPTTQPVTASDRQDAALRDPFGYSPDIGSSDDISGGNINQYDRKAMRKDINDVLNP